MMTRGVHVDGPFDPNDFKDLPVDIQELFTLSSGVLSPAAGGPTVQRFGTWTRIVGAWARFCGQGKVVELARMARVTQTDVEPRWLVEDAAETAVGGRGAGP